MGTPWCYTSSPEVRWDVCDVPLCDNVDCVSSQDALDIKPWVNLCGSSNPGNINNVQLLYVPISFFNISELHLV